MNEAVKKKWLQALRSGEYEQGFYFLYKDDSFCCLGVLCDLYLTEHKKKWDKINNPIKTIDEEKKLLPESVIKWAGLQEKSPKLFNGNSLISINDDRRLKFDQIADLIEAEM